MGYVKPRELRELIFAEINPTIETRREFDENYFWLEHNPPATEQEIDDFILSIPYFTQELRDFLLNEFLGVKEMLITEEWKEEFVQKVNIWAKGCEWLYSGASFYQRSSIKVIEEPLEYNR